MRIINCLLVGNAVGGGNIVGNTDMCGGRANGDICLVHVRIGGGILITERVFVGAYDGEGELPDEPNGL